MSGNRDVQKRLSHYIPFELDFVPDVKNRKNLSEKEQKQLEGEAILNRIQPGDHVVLLDDKGKQYSSMEFSAFIEAVALGAQPFVFVVGGPYICRPSIRPCKRETVLSRMTLPTRYWLVFAEQLYRAMTILNGESYHHE